MSDGFLEGLGSQETPVKTESPESAQPAAENSAELTPGQQDLQNFEQTAEAKDNFLEKAAEDAPTTTVPPAQGQTAEPAAAPTLVQKDDVAVEVDKILEDGLGDFVEDMPAEARQRFLTKGQEVSGQIAVMVRGFHVEVRRVIQLIQEWLQTIPAVNRFFLEQEAKIKTDRIVDLARIRKEESQNKT